MRKAFYAFNFAILGLFIAAVVVDQCREWKTYQKTYYKMEADRLRDSLASAKPEDKEGIEAQIKGFKRKWPEIKQIMATDLGRVDRCVTCHVGMDEFTNPTLTNSYKENPYKAHPGDIHKSHDFQRYGCTSCHQGQGLATTAETAHGFIKHWEEPMLKPPYIQASCAKCHAGFEKLHGAETAALGKKLFNEQGCIGCHSLKGSGGEISVDLGDIADKPFSRIDFSHADLEHKDENIQNWIEVHLTKDPMVLVPGDPRSELCPPGVKCEPIPPSGMPPYYKELEKGEAQAITTYLLSMTEDSVPHKYFVYDAPAAEPKFTDPVKHGQHVFQKYGCAACHGQGAKQGRRNYNALASNQTQMEEGVAPTLVKTLGTFTAEELKKKIQDGVPSSAIAKFQAEGPTPPLRMPAWKEKIQGKELDDLVAYLLSIAEKQKGEEW